MAERPPLPAWHLPGLELLLGRSEWHEGRTAGGAPFRSPRLTARQAEAAALEALRAALEARAGRDVRTVVARVSAAALSLADRTRPAGREAAALLGVELGWPPALARETLGGMAEGWSEGALLGLLEAELGDPAVLDGFCPAPAAARPGGGSAPRLRRAAGPPLLFQVEAGNVPGVGITGVIRALLARSGVLVKLPEGEPGLTSLFARTLAAADPLLGRAVAAAWWPGGEPVPAWEAWVKYSGKVVVYGGEEAVMAARAAAPASAEVVAYGPRVGVAVVFAGATEDAPAETPGAAPVSEGVEGAAGRLARDVCAYEGQGCVSPRVIFVVGGPAAPFAARLGRVLEEEVARTGVPRPTAGEAAAIRRVRAEAEFRAYAEATEGAAPPGPGVLGPEDLAWTVLVSETPELAVEDLPRLVRVSAVPDLESLLRVLDPLEGRIQALGHAGAGERQERELAEGAARLGVSRVAPLGALAWPPADWRHDGRHQLLPLLWWTEWEK